MGPIEMVKTPGKGVEIPKLQLKEVMEMQQKHLETGAPVDESSDYDSAKDGRRPLNDILNDTEKYLEYGDESYYESLQQK